MKERVRKLFGPAIEFLEFLGGVMLALPEFYRGRKRRWREFFYYFDICGWQSLLIVVLICFLMGVVLGIQGAIQMRKVGTEIFMVDLIGFSVLKELGPLMVAIIATGRAGSAFAAEIGTMKVNEELSALHTMGITPEGYLVWPKLAAMIIALPLLTVCGDIAGILGGMSIGSTVLQIPVVAYWTRTVTVLDIPVLFVGLIKSAIYGFLITLAGCFCGFFCSSDAQGVGRAATRAVVMSIFMIVISDAVMTLLFSFVGW